MMDHRAAETHKLDEVVEHWRAIEDGGAWAVIGVNLLPAPRGGWRAYAERIGSREPVAYAEGDDPAEALERLREVVR